MPVDREIMQKWVAALRSGNYQQGKAALRTDDGKFCCLGVLAEVSGIDVKSIQGFAPKINAAYALSSQQADKDWRIFSRMNDIENKTFNEIADYIEKEVLGV